jgi:hypothetical protein
MGARRRVQVRTDEIHDRYFKGRADGLRLNGVARLLKARR